MKSIVLVAFLFAVAASPASAQVVRVSVSTAGDQANGPSGLPDVSATGRYVVFASTATNLVASDTNGASDVFLRDRDTDADGVFDEVGAVATTRLSVGASAAQLDGASTSPVITSDGRYVAFVSTATNLLAGATAASQVYRLDRTSGTVVRVSVDTGAPAGDQNSDQPAISADGNVVAFRSRSTNLQPHDLTPHPDIYLRDVTAGTTVRASGTPGPGQVSVIDYAAPSVSADGNRIAFVGNGGRLGLFGFVFERPTQTLRMLDVSLSTKVDLTADGRSVVVRGFSTIHRRVIDTGATSGPLAAPGGSPSIPPATSRDGRLILTEGARLGDFTLGISTPLPFVPGGGAFSADDRWLAVVSGTSTLLPGNADTNAVDDVFVIDLPDILDADDDTMDDRLELMFTVTDPNADPDADGQTNAQELAVGTHPNGQVRRFLAEGATGSFFHTAISLANPSPTLAATAVLTFDRGDGTRVRRPVAVPAGRSTVVDVGGVAGLETSDVSTTIESDRLLGVQREMAWGASAIRPYGSHAETATTAPSPTWFLAEGSTVLGFELFYLLQNPQTTATNATVRFLLPSGTVISRTYNLAAGSRTTIYVNQVEGLDETDVSGDISADAPIVVERAMYRGSPSQPFVLGHDSIGVPAAATSWFLAEGATGSFFDLYVLIANPGNTDATVRADYARPDGSVVTQNYTVRAHSRHSVYVDSITGLSATSVATTLTSTNGVPIVAERAMYWPGGFFDYYEGHSSAGSTTTATEWVVSAGENVTTSVQTVQTFVLIANTSASAGEATLTVLPERGYDGTLPAPIVVTLPASSRTTVPITAIGGTFGVRVVSTGGSPVPLVVESALYRSVDGLLWSAGANALATPVP
jgi:Tol biopolymer transport system component